MNNKNKKIIAISIALVIVIGALFILIPEKEQDSLTVSVGGESIKEDSWFLTLLKSLKLADVFGYVEEEEWHSGYDGFILAPSQQVTMSVTAYHPDSEASGAYYRACVYDPWRILYYSSEVFLLPNVDKMWTFTYTASPSEGSTTVYFETEKKAFGSTIWEPDDIHYFDIVVIDGTVDPCEGVICNPFCVGEEYYYGGVCVNGDCVFEHALVDGECGYTAPPADPCAGISCPDKCTEPFTRLTNGVCVDGSCDYTETLNSPICGYEEPDPCTGVMCPDKCDGTTLLFDGHCEGGSCVYDGSTPETVVCGFNVPDPCIGVDCPDICVGTTRMSEGYCFGGECSYNIEMIDSPLCGYAYIAPEVVGPTPTPPTPGATATPDGTISPIDDTTDGTTPTSMDDVKDVATNPVVIATGVVILLGGGYLIFSKGLIKL